MSGADLEATGAAERSATADDAVPADRERAAEVAAWLRSVAADADRDRPPDQA
jgi:hypothetical protein